MIYRRLSGLDLRLYVLVFDDDETAFKFLNKLTLSYLRDHMLPNIESTVKQLDIIPEVLSKVDHKFYKIIGSIQPLYSLSSVISIFSHDLSKFDDLCLVWDFIFVQNDPCLVLYVYVSILIYYKDDILNDLDELSGKSYSSDDTLIDESTSMHEVEFYNKDFVHVILNNLINNNLNSTNSIDSNLEIFNILQLSLKYLNMYPPSSLDSVNNISNYSVLKDQRLDSSLLALQIAEQAEQLAKEKAENELLYKRQQEQKPKKTTNPPSSPPKKRLNWLTLRNKNLSLIVKLSLSIGLLGIVINYAVQHNSNLSFLRPKLQYIGLNGGSIFASFDSYNAKGFSILANHWCSQAGEFIDQVINGVAKGINNQH